MRPSVIVGRRRDLAPVRAEGRLVQRSRRADEEQLALPVRDVPDVRGPVLARGHERPSRRRRSARRGRSRCAAGRGAACPWRHSRSAPCGRSCRWRAAVPSGLNANERMPGSGRCAITRPVCALRSDAAVVLPNRVATAKTCPVGSSTAVTTRAGEGDRLDPPGREVDEADVGAARRRAASCGRTRAQ